MIATQMLMLFLSIGYTVPGRDLETEARKAKTWIQKDHRRAAMCRSGVRGKHAQKLVTKWSPTGHWTLAGTGPGHHRTWQMPYDATEMPLTTEQRVTGQTTYTRSSIPPSSTLFFFVSFSSFLSAFSHSSLLSFFSHCSF